MINYGHSDLFLKDGIRKDFIITYNGGVITNEQLHYESFALTESISAESELRFGGCEAAMIEFKVVNTVDSLTGKELTVAIVLDEDYDNPFVLGTYKVDSDKLTADRRHRNIVAYDAMYTLNNTEVSDWYNGIMFPTTLGGFRNALFEYLGFSQQEIELPNDNALIKATPQYDELFAGDLLKDICELNGCFGRISRDNEFEYVFIDTESQSYTIDKSKHNNTLEYEDYVTQRIDGITLTQNNADIKINYGLGKNMYALQVRVLNLGEVVEPINTIAKNIYSKIGNVDYVPFSMGAMGNPCLECGDKISVYSGGILMNTFLLERKLTGIQNLQDSYSAEGAEKYEKQNISGGVSSSIDEAISNINRDNFYSHTFTNSQEYVVGQEDKSIIQFNIAATAKTDVIFVATIPIVTDRDGELVLNYALDAIVQEKQELRQYLHAGNNLVTIANYFDMGENTRLIMEVRVRMEYVESVERLHTAQISAFEEYINSGTYNVSVDTTLPTGKIGMEKIRATIFSKGLAMGNEWDGTITVAESFEPIVIYNNIESWMYGIFTDTIEDINQQHPTPALATDIFSIISLGNIAIVGMQDTASEKSYLREYLVIPFGPYLVFFNENYIETDEDLLFRLRTDYKYTPQLAVVDSGRMSSIFIRTDDKSNIESVVFE